MLKESFYFLALLLPVLPAAAAPTKAPAKTPIVFIEEIKSSEIFDVLSYPARLIPKVNATLVSDVDGVVQSISAPLGQKVKRGQKVMTLKSTDPVYDYAPFSLNAQVAGIVSSIEVTEGTRIVKGQKLAQITDPGKVKITIEVSVADFSAIRPGLEGSLSVPGLAEPIGVKVIGISPLVDAATGSATAELAALQGAPALPPGAIGKVIFRAREHQGVQIPEGSVTFKGPDPFVRIVEGEQAKYVPVQLGETRQGFVEVVKGLNVGQKVIVRANAFVAEGEKVEIQKSEPKS